MKSKLLSIIAGLLLLAGCRVSTDNSAEVGLAAPVTTLESEGINLLLEKAELSRELYLNIYYSKGLVVFNTMSTDTETVLVNKMNNIISVYGLVSPSTGSPYTYTDPNLQILYDGLLNNATGASSTNLSALLSGAMLEETNIIDVALYRPEILAEHGAIREAFDKVMCESRNQLRTLAYQIESLTGTPYAVQTTSNYSAINYALGSPIEVCLSTPR